MVRLEHITRGTLLKGLLPSGPVTVVDVRWHGSNVIELFYKDASGRPGTELVFRDREPVLEIVTPGRPWSLEADGAALRLVSEALRIRLAHLFDPLLAVHTSLIEPLPHQITAVYGEMLRRQPLRFLLADDPGAGKTIMAGLLIKELRLRGDVHRCLIVCPGSLVEQWQDELSSKFDLPFEILTNDRIEAARTGNALAEMPLVIARLDKLARDEALQAKLARTEWDLVVVDEAHKMSASFFGGEVKETKRYKLGKLLGTITRHFLLMTATPHNGKEEDFQLFMALLDGDRFEGRFRDGVHTTDVSDLMRRMVKEDLVRFDGTPLFPERRAYTVAYELSDGEAALYKAVTDYVRQEFNRADALQNEGRKGTVGFALTILQRRLASSPEAIYQSLRRRRERLERRLREEEVRRRGAQALVRLASSDAAATAEGRLGDWRDLPQLDEEDWVDFEEDTPGAERERIEEEIVDQATAAQTIAELRGEIETLKQLEALALRVRQSGTDRKWEELSKILQDREVMFDARGHRRKLVIFTEHRDTVRYLAWRIQTLLGRPEAVVVIDGAMGREERRKVQEAFTQDPDVHVLVATDAAGEGINLQRAHLMVNYDLPWNPNRLEQRFGRIHRIGQTEVCHLWNLVARDTREGEVYLALLRKLEAEQRALGGRVFDVLGKAIHGAELRKLMIEAIRYGDRPEVRERLNRVVTERLDRERLRRLLEEGALARDTLDARAIQQIREEMERAEARRLQPHFIEAFFLEAFRRLGGAARQREPRRYEITHVPSVIRQRDRVIGRGAPVLPRYERICFEKELIRVPGRPPAAFVCPGHPLLDATLDVILERYRPLLKQGAVLVDERDPGETPRWLFYLEHAIRDGRVDGEGRVRVVSRRLQFVEIDAEGRARNAGYAPYLDYRPVAEEEKALLALELEARLEGTQAHDLEAQAVSYAIAHLVPEHLEEVRRHKVALVEKTVAAVKDRLTKEIAYWDHRAEELRLQEQAGKVNARINSARARQRADELQARLEKRMRELEQEKNLAALPPEVLGYALIVPVGLLRRLRGEVAAGEPGLFARETEEVERLAMEAVMEAERALGYEPRDVSRERCGYDIESRIPTQPGRLRFIEVKGRVAGARTVTVTKNEILTALNKPDDYILALVQVEGGRVRGVRYVRRPFRREPDFGAASVNYDFDELWGRGEEPR
ncbi:DUF3883 domain-containing protein [Thermaerobacter sp. FW80]|uniref:helicase-related protein n=1 Tax=Thermaerobacter sp. FW80 TaxID=2546351 RepID=UPI001075265B|nr:helicase-related protein [Thermaerobacter sp. FW80]QBS38323.1 DUF3883 domain-containing protein [Thermaerobacter sp. FW80]